MIDKNPYWQPLINCLVTENSNSTIDEFEKYSIAIFTILLFSEKKALLHESSHNQISTWKKNN